MASVPVQRREAVSIDHSRPLGEVSESRRFDTQHSESAAEQIHQATCPACGHHVAVTFLDAEQQPLATISWPESADAAVAMESLPLAFVRCVDCGHVYNARFDYALVPYSTKPNLMFNQGTGWSRHLTRVRDLLLDALPAEPVVVEVGCGEGHLLRALAESRPAGRYIGFDPNASVNTEGRFTARAELFEPARHVAEIRPDLIVSRHVLEHLVNPLGFLQAVDFAADSTGLLTRVFIEVPCIDRVLETGRTVDFYFEHNSHFTTRSFTRMLHRSSQDVEMLVHGYQREVICGLAVFGRGRLAADFAAEAEHFCEAARQAKVTIGRQLCELAESGMRVAVWGGTGKAAAFINRYGVDRHRFPLVVDSDADKVGTFVPGAGQRIQFRDALLDQPADVLIIPMQWRVRDILQEMSDAGITAKQVLIEHRGRLIDFHTDEHPYA
ncbi:MAG: methyltransferase domain-containing protein [Planctomycetes bacterium]|nr:methyltransferase domain-containing protein [Planctomycetota bacterium]